jgi:hypothetical protein
VTLNAKRSHEELQLHVKHERSEYNHSPFIRLAFAESSPRKGKERAFTIARLITACKLMRGSIVIARARKNRARNAALRSPPRKENKKKNGAFSRGGTSELSARSASRDARSLAKADLRGEAENSRNSRNPLDGRARIPGSAFCTISIQSRVPK